MSVIAAVAALLLLVLIACNALVTRGVHADDYLDPFQKRAQTAIVWLLPLMGALLVWIPLRHSARRKRTDGLEDEDDLVDDIDSGYGMDTDAAGGDGLGGAHTD